MKHKLFESAELKIKNDGNGTISGYASTWEPFDRVNEKPARGAFAPYLRDFVQHGFIAVGHDWAGLPVATLTDAIEDNHGLFFSADFHSTAAAQEARIVTNERLERGKSVATSIGYDLLDSEMIDAPELPGGKGRLLKAVQLFEVSLVTVPANPAALLTAAKGRPASGVPFDLQARMAESAVRAFADRAQRRLDARVKEGRVLSGTNREKLSSLRTSLADVLGILEDLLAATEPASAGKQTSTAIQTYEQEIRNIIIQNLLAEAEMNGVHIQ